MTYKDKPFSFTVRRNSTNETIFSTENSSLILSEYYLEISNYAVPSLHIYGFGERNSFFRIDHSINTIFTMDQPTEYDDGSEGRQTYGLHPLYLTREKSAKFDLVFFRNSNAMDIIVGELDELYPGGKNYKKTITYKTVGGVLDFKFFLGETPDDAVKQFH